MKVFNLACAQGHGFEGWFGSEADYVSQQERSLVSCPLCGDHSVKRMPNAPRLNLSGARERGAPPAVAPASPAGAGATSATSGASDVVAQGSSTTAASDAASSDIGSDSALTARVGDLQAAWLQTVRRLMANTEDVGERFAEEARRIHYGEKPDRGIRGQASPEEREALREEGIETMAIPVPAALKGPLQ